MKKKLCLFLIIGMVAIVAGCGEKQDSNVKRGDMFLENKKFAEAIQAYEKAVEAKPELMQDDIFKQHFKDAYYFKGGQVELSADSDPDILKVAYKYYIKGFDVWPKEVGMCDKLVKFFWEQEEFETAAKYLKHMVEFDAEMPETDKNKWPNLHNDYYNLGYALFEAGQYKEAKEAFEQALKAMKNGPKAKQAKSAIEAVSQKMNK